MSTLNLHERQLFALNIINKTMLLFLNNLVQRFSAFAVSTVTSTNDDLLEFNTVVSDEFAIMSLVL